MMSRLLGLLLIIRALTPIIIVLLIAGLAMIIVNSVSASLEKPLQIISDEVETVQVTLTDAQEDFVAVQESVGKLVTDLQNFTIPNPLALLATNISIPAIDIPDLPAIPLPQVSVTWSDRISISYPSSISFSFTCTAGICITWSDFNIRYPTSVSVTTEDFILAIPDIPQFSVEIPGLALLRDAVEGIIDEITSIFDVFDPAFVAIDNLTETLQTLPASVDTILTATQDAFGSVSRTVAQWSMLIGVVTIVILLLIVNYIFSTMIQDLQQGWTMLRGQS